MPELSLAPDPALWSLVPGRDDADGWVLGLLGSRAQEQQESLLLAAELALQAREASDGGMTLLLAHPDSQLYAALTVVVTAFEPVSDAETAADVARAVAASDWESALVEVEIGTDPAWRASVLTVDPEAVQDPLVATPSHVRTVYVFAVSDHLAVAALSPLTPSAAAAAQVLAEPVLRTAQVIHVGA